MFSQKSQRQAVKGKGSITHNSWCVFSGFELNPQGNKNVCTDSCQIFQSAPRVLRATSMSKEQIPAVSLSTRLVRNLEYFLASRLRSSTWTHAGTLFGPGADYRWHYRSPLMGTCRFLTATASLAPALISSHPSLGPNQKFTCLFFYEVLMYVALKVTLS